jgi:hypothetical protein
VKIQFLGCTKKKRKKRNVHMVPVLGAILEAPTPATRTPQFQTRWPMMRRLILAFQMSDSQQVTVTIKVMDKKGNPAPVDGVPVWLTDNTELLALTPAADGLSCLVAAVGPLGTATVSVTADADLGAGVTPIVGTLDVQITGGTATTATLAPGTPTEQP